MKYLTKFQRFNKFLELLQNGKYGLEELKEILKVSGRTILRYIEELKKKGIHLKYDNKAKKYYIEKGSQICLYPFKISITDKELDALYSAFDLLKKRKNFPLISELDSLIKKIEEYKGDIEYKSIFEVTSFSVFPEDLKVKYNLIKEAINEKKYVEFDYYGSKEKRVIRRRVAPWFLIHAFGKWYLIGYCILRDEMRTFDLGRIKNINKLDEFCYEKILGKNYKEFMRDMFGPWKGEKGRWVSIFYDREVSKNIEEKIFPQEHKIEKFKDGSIRLKIKVSHPEALLFYLVLPYHYHAEVELPKSLRKKLVNYLKKALNKYTRYKNG